MLYLIKDFFHKLYFKFSQSKFIKWIFPIFIICFVPNVFAGEYLGGTDFGWAWNGSTSVGYYQDLAGQNLPKSFSLSANGSSSNWNLNLYSSTYDFGNYKYFYLDVCNNYGTGAITAVVSNSSYGTSYFNTGSYHPFVDLGACPMGNTNLTHHQVIEIPIGRMNLADSYYTVDSYLKFVSSASYGSSFQINYAYVSDTKLSISQDMINKLNSINTTISNMQSAITNNQNSNTQSIINNQNSNTNSINSNIDDNFDDLMNEDHSYTNTPYDSPDGSSDINSTINKENQLRNNLNLDSSNVIVTLNTNATTYIWGIIDRIRAVDSRIVLLFTTVLSLGIIKMILNR